MSQKAKNDFAGKVRLAIIIWIFVILGGVALYFQGGFRISASTDTGSIAGKITRNTRPLAGAVVTSRGGLYDNSATTTSDSAGNYFLSIVDVGAQTVTAAWQDSTGVATVFVFPGRTMTANIEIVTDVGTISGVVTKNDKPVSGAKVTAQGGLYDAVINATTDGEGKFTLENTDVGAQTVTATWQNMKGSTKIFVFPDRTTTANVAISASNQ